MSRAQAAVVTQQFAQRIYGSQDTAVGQESRSTVVPFAIIGTFRERVETFGQSEIAGYTVLIPYSVAQSFAETGAQKDAVKQIFFSVC